ncbi:hypothetical protein MCA1628 [Methylococcus capsulatus str. Bath]|uniref:Uncharacterized protein n=1 Tax=Methylococcus capsulatus (strain ATCC 33009 / NCIMB 11132 / Bath) TaxID=243233 RepID=Q607X5_METCA|nr:hypothetical protein MCA1628 [Methylococcus capsulatus str. Bath]
MGCLQDALFQAAIADQVNLDRGGFADLGDVRPPVAIGDRVPGVGDDDGLAGHAGAAALHVADEAVEDVGDAVPVSAVKPVMVAKFALPFIAPGVAPETAPGEPLQGDEVRHIVAGVGRFAGVAVDLAIAAGQDFPEPVHVQFATGGCRGDGADGGGMFAGVFFVACFHHVSS